MSKAWGWAAVDKEGCQVVQSRRQGGMQNQMKHKMDKEWIME